MSGAQRKRPIDAETRRRIIELRCEKQLSYDLLAIRFQRSSETIRKICLEAGLDAGRAAAPRYFQETPGSDAPVAFSSAIFRSSGGAP